MGQRAKMEIRYLWKEQPEANREVVGVCAGGDYHLTGKKNLSLKVQRPNDSM